MSVEHAQAAALVLHGHRRRRRRQLHGAAVLALGLQLCLEVAMLLQERASCSVAGKRRASPRLSKSVS